MMRDHTLPLLAVGMCCTGSLPHSVAAASVHAAVKLWMGVIWHSIHRSLEVLWSYLAASVAGGSSRMLMDRRIMCATCVSSWLVHLQREGLRTTPAFEHVEESSRRRLVVQDPYALMGCAAGCRGTTCMAVS